MKSVYFEKALSGSGIATLLLCMHLIATPVEEQCYRPDKDPNTVHRMGSSEAIRKATEL